MSHRGSQRVQIRQRHHEDGEVKRDVFDLIIPLGKGRKHAELIRAKVEIALREILPVAAPPTDSATEQ